MSRYASGHRLSADIGNVGFIGIGFFLKPMFEPI